MKLFPCLTIASLCAAFVGCSTTQTVSFEPENTAQDGITVSIDGKTLGVAPVEFETLRTDTAKSHQVIFSKPGYRSEVAIIESYEDEDGLHSFMDSYPIPELLPAPASPVSELPPAPEPAPEEVSEIEIVEEPAPEPAVVEEPAPEPAEEPVVDKNEPTEDVDTPVVPPTKADAEQATSTLDPNRTLKDIEADLKSLVAQRQNGQLSEAEFQKACAELEKEVRTRYGK